MKKILLNVMVMLAVNEYMVDVEANAMLSSSDNEIHRPEHSMSLMSSSCTSFSSRERPISETITLDRFRRLEIGALLHDDYKYIQSLFNYEITKNQKLREGSINNIEQLTKKALSELLGKCSDENVKKSIVKYSVCSRIYRPGFILAAIDRKIEDVEKQYKCRIGKLPPLTPEKEEKIAIRLSEIEGDLNTILGILHEDSTDIPQHCDPLNPNDVDRLRFIIPQDYAGIFSLIDEAVRLQDECNKESKLIKEKDKLCATYKDMKEALFLHICNDIVKENVKPCPENFHDAKGDSIDQAYIMDEKWTSLSLSDILTGSNTIFRKKRQDGHMVNVEVVEKKWESFCSQMGLTTDSSKYLTEDGKIYKVTGIQLTNHLFGMLKKFQQCYPYLSQLPIITVFSDSTGVATGIGIKKEDFDANKLSKGDKRVRNFITSLYLFNNLVRVSQLYNGTLGVEDYIKGYAEIWGCRYVAQFPDVECQIFTETDKWRQLYNMELCKSYVFPEKTTVNVMQHIFSKTETQINVSDELRNIFSRLFLLLGNITDSTQTSLNDLESMSGPCTFSDKLFNFIIDHIGDKHSYMLTALQFDTDSRVPDGNDQIKLQNDINMALSNLDGILTVVDPILVGWVFQYINSKVSQYEEIIAARRELTPEENNQLEDLAKCGGILLQGLHHCAAGKLEAIMSCFTQLWDTARSNGVTFNSTLSPIDRLKKTAALIAYIVSNRVFNKFFTFAMLPTQEDVNNSRVAEQYKSIYGKHPGACKILGKEEWWKKFKDGIDNIGTEGAMRTTLVSQSLRGAFGVSIQIGILGWFIPYEPLRYLVLEASDWKLDISNGYSFKAYSDDKNVRGDEIGTREFIRLMQNIMNLKFIDELLENHCALGELIFIPYVEAFPDKAASLKTMWKNENNRRAILQDILTKLGYFLPISSLRK